VAFSFSKYAYAEALRAKNENGITVDLIELEERITPNPKFANRPEYHTILSSKITKRQWGAKE